MQSPRVSGRHCHSAVVGLLLRARYRSARSAAAGCSARYWYTDFINHYKLSWPGLETQDKSRRILCSCNSRSMVLWCDHFRAKWLAAVNKVTGCSGQQN